MLNASSRVIVLTLRINEPFVIGFESSIFVITFDMINRTEKPAYHSCASFLSENSRSRMLVCIYSRGRGGKRLKYKSYARRNAGMDSLHERLMS